jgi:hypothetical protein
MKVPGQGLHLGELRMKSRLGYAAVRIFSWQLYQKEARLIAGPPKSAISGYQPLTNAPPLDLQAASDAIEKP